MTATAFNLTRSDGPSEIVLALSSVGELFDASLIAGVRGSVLVPTGGRHDWDAIGAALGEAGVTRLMRLLEDRPQASSLRLRIAVQVSEHQNQRADEVRSAEVEARLRAWCEARIAAARWQEKLARRFGLRMLMLALVVMAVAMGGSWLLTTGAIFGEPGPLLSVVAEALVIAGWVVMWRPIEMIVFDPLTPAHERRLLERARAMPCAVEWAQPG